MWSCVRLPACACTCVSASVAVCAAPTAQAKVPQSVLAAYDRIQQRCGKHSCCRPYRKRVYKAQWQRARRNADWTDDDSLVDLTHDCLAIRLIYD